MRRGGRAGARGVRRLKRDLNPNRLAVAGRAIVAGRAALLGGERLMPIFMVLLGWRITATGL